MLSIRHQPVMEDWTRFAPTKAVNQRNSGLTQWARERLKSTKLPAIKRILRSNVTVFASLSMLFLNRRQAAGRISWAIFEKSRQDGKNPQPSPGRLRPPKDQRNDRGSNDDSQPTIP